MAVINIGSGSVKLHLQSTNEFKSAVTLLALSGGNKYKTTTETFDAVAAFCLDAQKKGEKIAIFGTEAMRQNGELATLIESKLGIKADIIDGQTEALCGFLGCGEGENGRKTVIDVGGASTEISCGRLKPDFSTSLKIGAVALYNVISSEKITDLSHVFDYIDGALNFTSFDDSGKIYLIGGAALYLAAIIKNNASQIKKPSDFDMKTVSDTKLNTCEVLTVLKNLSAMDVKQRVVTYPFIEEKRALVLPFGISIIYRILAKLSAKEAYVSTAGLIEGYIKLRNL